jgi:lipid-binding SYLF domain-containing protein
MYYTHKISTSGILTLLLGYSMLTFFASTLNARDVVDKSALEKRLIRSQESFNNINISKNSGPIPPQLVRQAQGILIFRQYGGGFFVGGKGGFGVAMARQRDGRWGPPAFLKSVDGSFGLQIGGQRIDMVLLFMNRQSLEVFQKGKFRIGVDLGAAAGPVGAKIEGKVGAPVLVYANNAGLYIGAAFEGGVLVPDNIANDSLYDREGTSAGDILLRGSVSFPPEAEGLRLMLERYGGQREPEERSSGSRGSSNNDNWWQPRRPDSNRNR